MSIVLQSTRRFPQPFTSGSKHFPPCPWTCVLKHFLSFFVFASCRHRWHTAHKSGVQVLILAFSIRIVLKLGDCRLAYATSCQAPLLECLCTVTVLAKCLPCWSVTKARRGKAVEHSSNPTKKNLLPPRLPRQYAPLFSNAF